MYEDVILLLSASIIKTASRRGTCVLARIIACLGPERLMPNWWHPELRSSAFRPILTPRVFRRIRL